MKFSLQSALLLFSLSTVDAFAPSPSSSSLHQQKIISSKSHYTLLFNYDKDTEVVLPSFDTKEDYLNYITDASALPKGFATGSAIGSFVPEEAPSKGKLPIKATLIHLIDGPTDNWAATFTQNMVRFFHFSLYVFF